MQTRLLTAAALAAVLLSLTAMPAQATEPSLSINDVTVQEPSYGQKTAEFTISLDAPTDHDVAVGFRLNAHEPQVLNAPFSGSRTIRAGETTASIPFTVRYTESTSDYTFTLDLGWSTGAVISDSVGVGTVLHTIPAGSFVCQAMQRNGAAGTGETAGSPDGKCSYYRKEWDNGGGIGTDYTRAGLPTATAWVDEVSTSYLIETPWYVPVPQLHTETYVGFHEARSRVRVSCGPDDSHWSMVAGLGVYVRGENTLVGPYSKEITEYQSIPLANGWRLELNLTETVGSGDVRFIRQTAVRLTAPDGLTTSFAVAEVGPTGDPCS